MTQITGLHEWTVNWCVQTSVLSSGVHSRTLVFKGQKRRRGKVKRFWICGEHPKWRTHAYCLPHVNLIPDRLKFTKKIAQIPQVLYVDWYWSWICHETSRRLMHHQPDLNRALVLIVAWFDCFGKAPNSEINRLWQSACITNSLALHAFQRKQRRHDPTLTDYHDTVLWYISFHYPKQSPYFCTQVLQNSQSSFHTSTVQFASQCAAYPAIPWHCTFSLPSTLSSRSSIFAPSRALPQSCFCKHAQPLRTYFNNKIAYFNILLPCSLLCAASQTASPIRSSHMPPKKGGRRHQGGSPYIILLKLNVRTFIHQYHLLEWVTLICTADVCLPLGTMVLKPQLTKSWKVLPVRRTKKWLAKARHSKHGQRDFVCRSWLQVLQNHPSSNRVAEDDKTIWMWSLHSNHFRSNRSQKWVSIR